MKAKPGEESTLPEEDRIVRIAEVQRICALSRSSIYGEMRRKRFPAPLKLCKRGVGWSLNEINRWIAEQKTRR